MFGREPVLWLTAIRAFVILVTAFGLELTVEQIGAVYLSAEAILSLVTRSQVTPVESESLNG